MSRGDLSQSNQELINFPEEWEPVLLKDVFNKVSIGSKKLAKAKYKKKGLYPVIDQGQNYISGYCDDSSKTVNVRSPVIVFGDHTCSVKLIEQSFVPGADGIKVLAVKKGCPYFFRYLLAFIAEVHPRKGYARHYHHLEKLQIRCPSIDVQKHISASIIKLERALERALGELSRVDENLSLYKQSVLIAAIRGKLVPQDPNDEPASELLKRIRAEKEALVKAKKIRKEKPLPPIDPEEVPFDLPAGWEWVRLRDICLSIVDGDHQAPPKAPEGIPFLVISNITSGTINYETSRFVPQVYYDALNHQRIARKGDVLYSVTGSFGVPALVTSEEPFAFQRHIALLKPMEELSKEYFLMYLKSPFAFNQALKRATGTAQKTVPIRRLRRFLVPLPPKKEQERILVSLKKAMNSASESELMLKQSVDHSELLRKAILKCAFEGKLI